MIEFPWGGEVEVLDDGQLAAGELLRVYKDARLHLDDGHVTADTIELEGELTGTGTINGDIVNNGTIEPGQSPGTLEIEGDYTQGEDGELVMEVGGTEAGAYDPFLVEGDATLEGELVLEFIDEFTPEPGDQFKLIEAETLMADSSNISTVGLEEDSSMSSFEYDTSGGTLTAMNPVPSPTSVALLGLGGLTLFGRAR